MLAAPGASCVCSGVPVRIPIAHASRMPFADRSVSPLMVPMTCGRSFGEPQPGEHLLACFQPFIKQLASSSLSPKTIRKHVDNLWLLGGEIIRDLNDDPALRKVTADRLLRNVIHQ